MLNALPGWMHQRGTFEPTTGEAGALGGRLSLDAHELTFKPHSLERTLGGNTSYRTPLRDIVAVDVARRGAVPHKRLFVRTRDGVEARFLIPHVDDRVAALREALSLTDD